MFERIKKLTLAQFLIGTIAVILCGGTILGYILAEDGKVGLGIKADEFSNKFNQTAQSLGLSYNLPDINIQKGKKEDEFRQGYIKSMMFLGTVYKNGNIKEVTFYYNGIDEEYDQKAMDVLRILITTISPDLTASQRDDLLKILNITGDFINMKGGTTPFKPVVINGKRYLATSTDQDGFYFTISNASE